MREVFNLFSFDSVLQVKRSCYFTDYQFRRPSTYPGRRIRVHDTTRVTISFLNILSLIIVKGNVTSCLPPVDLLRKMADLVTASMKNDHLQVCW